MNNERQNLDIVNNINILDLDEELIEITPVTNYSELSDAQDLPETSASIGQTGCCSYRSSKAN